MSTCRGILLGTLIVLALGAITSANAAVTYDAILEWNGPYFQVINDPAVPQMVNDPVTDLDFTAPFAVVAREHGANQRDVVYVLDSGHNRVQAFEVNASYFNDNTFTWQAGGAAAANDYDDNEIRLNEWAGPAASRWVLPGSEVLSIDGETWAFVANLAGYAAADKKYTIDYDAVAGPVINLPNGSLTATSTISVYYLLSDNQTGAADAFGLGDVDYGTGNGASPVLTKITESSGGPTSFQELRSLALIANEGTATSDDIFVLDAADNSVNQNEELFYYTVDLAGAVTYREAYDDVLTQAFDVAVAVGGPTEVAGAVTLAGVGTIASAASVRDASQLTGHSYSIAEAAGLVTVTDVTTGQVLVSNAALANMAATYLGIPGVSVTIDNAAGTGSRSIATTRAITDRYLFVCDTGADRIKVIAAEDNNPASPNDWLPGDQHTMAAQPAGAGLVGASADVDYRYTTPNPVPADYTVYTLTSPIKEGTLAGITFDPTGTPVAWTRVDDLVTAGPADLVYTVDWTNGKIVFGDGIHGQIPPANTAFEFGYTTTPDVLRYGTTGNGPGRFSGPRGIAARWNAKFNWYDVYVADTGNHRLQKLAFIPADLALNIPARMEYVCEWKTASSSADLLSSPVDVVVESDGSYVYLAVADQGNDRIVTYVDIAATTTGGATAPTWDARLGSLGNNLGTFMQVEGLCFLANGTDLDLYACDAHRGKVTKFEESPTPTIALSFVGVSTLPACFPPTSSYTFSFTTTNAPAGGTIDFYYDTESTFDEATAKLCIEEGKTPATATSAVWIFQDTPGGVPPDGTSYYLFARMKDGNGTVVATDQTTSSEQFCVDSSLLPGLWAVDRIDNDTVLYLQNGLQRTINLQVAYPESLGAVGYAGTFPAAQIEVVDVADGNPWVGSGAEYTIFLPTFDNAAGTFEVNSSAIGIGQIGLVSAGPHTVALLTIKAKPDVLSPSARFAVGAVELLTATSSMTDIHGNPPTQWNVKNVDLRFGYLGDIATDGQGAESELPHLAPLPDGKINFADQMIFTLGWNGKDGVQDPISDLGPTTGTVPNLLPNPDAQWGVDDLLAFTLMHSWAASAEKSRPVVRGESVAGQATALTASQLQLPKAGEFMTVDLKVENVTDLCGALLNLGYDPDQLELIDVENGGFLNGQSGSLFFHRDGEGWLEVAATRLDKQNPGVDGSGVVARAIFRILGENAGEFDLNYDLRSSDGTVLARGARNAGAFEGGPVGFKLYAPKPNPAHGSGNVVFSIPAATHVSLEVYDVSGRQLRSLVNGRREAGFHVASFDGRDAAGNLLPAGVYFYRLQAGPDQSTQKLILAR